MYKFSKINYCLEYDKNPMLMEKGRSVLCVLPTKKTSRGISMTRPQVSELYYACLALRLLKFTKVNTILNEGYFKWKNTVSQIPP